jgi:hypothetical protein
LFAIQIASRRLSGEGGLVIVLLPQAPAFAATSAVVVTDKVRGDWGALIWMVNVCEAAGLTPLEAVNVTG